MEQQQPRPTPSLSSKDLKLTDETFALYRHAVIGESVKSGHGEAVWVVQVKRGSRLGEGSGRSPGWSFGMGLIFLSFKPILICASHPAVYIDIACVIYPNLCIASLLPCHIPLSQSR